MLEPHQAPQPLPAELGNAAQQLGKATGAQSVILFGSFARGDARKDSDVDLLYITTDDADLLSIAARAERSLWPRQISIDLVPMRQSHWLNKSSPLARRAAQEGVLLYSK